MIFSDEFLQELRGTGINPHNLKVLVLKVANKCRELEKELKDGSNTEGNTPSASKTVGSS